MSEVTFSTVGWILLLIRSICFNIIYFGKNHFSITLKKVVTKTKIDGVTFCNFKRCNLLKQYNYVSEWKHYIPMATNIYKQENLEHFRSIVNVLLAFKIDIAFSMKNEQLARRKSAVWWK